MDAPAELIAAEITTARLSPDSTGGGLTHEPVVLTGCGAQMLFSRLGELLPPATLSVKPDFRAGAARGLIQIAKSTIIHRDRISFDKINFGPVYLRKSDAELNTGKG